MKTPSSRKINTLIKNNLKIVNNTKKYYLNFQSAERLMILLEGYGTKILLTSSTPLKNHRIYLTPTVKTIIKDNFTCVICNKKAVKAILRSNKSGNSRSILINFYTKGNILLTKDHIIPKANNGKNELSNYQCMCQQCNLEKGTSDNFKFLIKKGILKWDETFKLNWFERFVFSFITKRLKYANIS